jgi:hypothetical protein
MANSVRDPLQEGNVRARSSHPAFRELGFVLGPNLDALIAEWDGIEREIAEAKSRSTATDRS